MRLLHLSDLHAGMHSQAWLWPTFKHAFYDDLELLATRDGPWDVVVFSGDLTQRASTEDFKLLDEIISELWQKLSCFGPLPVMFPIPGNHDLCRPNPKDPAVVLLGQWRENDSIREDFWLGSTSAYEEKVTASFSHFLDWRDRLSDIGVTTPPLKVGVLPGDISTIIEHGEQRLGLVGLNSAWLQLSEGDYEGRLEVHPKQLMAVTNNDPVAWCKANTANLIVTHHPYSWFTPAARASWDSEIDPPGRFTAHLFGHMHESKTSVASQSGSPFKISAQAASLFGLERVQGELRRVHGYSGAQLMPSSGTLKIWPRRLRELNSGNWKLGPDFTFDLEEDNSVLLAEPRPTAKRSFTSPLAVSVAAPAQRNEKASLVLESLAYPIPHASAHRNVRRVEQKRSLSALQDTRTLWLASEWGMGAEGFLWAVKNEAGNQNIRTYRIGLQEFSTRVQFLSSIEETLNCSFQELCDAVAEKGATYIFLDEAPAGREPPSQGSTGEQELELVIRVMLDYCPDALIVVRSRQRPVNVSIPVVELRPLDEADLRTYVEDSDFSRDHSAHASLISDLFRLTDGAPSRVDAALRELQVAAVTELISSNPDFTPAGTVPVETPGALVSAVSEIAESEDPTLQRAYALLKALSAFPQGEQLQRIKRFHGVHPFFKGHAQELIGRSLLKSLVPQQGVGDSGSESANILIVSRPVREYVRSLLTSSEVMSIDRKALSLYFGDKWMSGEIHAKSGQRFDDPRRTNYEIVNAATIIIRFLRTAVATKNDRSIDAGIRIGSAFVHALEAGDHYRNAVTLCRDLLAALPSVGQEKQRAIIEFQLAGNLRMTGGAAQARDMILTLKLEELARDKRVEALLELALSYDRLGEIELALDAARQIKKLARTSFQALQAESIIIENTGDEASRGDRLKKLEIAARRKKASVTANNIALSRAMLPNTPTAEAEEIVKSVLRDSRTSGDFYNGTRAVISLTRHILNRNETPSEGIKLQLIVAYHYLFKERGNLFDACHRLLWAVFKQELDTENLLRLFRASSFIWRLRSDDKREREYVQDLGSILRSSSNRNFRRVDRELTYYIVRSNIAKPDGLADEIS